MRGHLYTHASISVCIYSNYIFLYPSCTSWRTFSDLQVLKGSLIFLLRPQRERATHTHTHNCLYGGHKRNSLSTSSSIRFLSRREQREFRAVSYRLCQPKEWHLRKVGPQASERSLKPSNPPGKTMNYTKISLNVFFVTFHFSLCFVDFAQTWFNAIFGTGAALTHLQNAHIIALKVRKYVF